MRWLDQDRLMAVGALRRVRAPAAESPKAEKADLAELVGATVARNRYGGYLRVRKTLSDPRPCAHAEALGLVLRPEPEARDLKEPRRWLFLDTETTGLAGGTGTCAFLVGLAWWEGEQLQIEQLFLRDYDEEHAVLLALAERLEERPVLVTYNGKSFDWPLLETRFRLTRQIEPQPPRAHLDLLHPARQLWRLQWGTARLAELERLVLGIERGPDVLSALIPQLYFDYLRGGSGAPLAPVFEHNQKDLAGLAAMTGRVAGLVHRPDDAEPLELYGLSRLLERRGETERARRVYEMAVQAGLPASLNLAARRRMARLARRGGERDVAHDLWRELANEESEESAEGNAAERREALEAILEACEQLAIHYEHQVRNGKEAAAWTRRGLALLRQSMGTERKLRQRWNDRLQHRLDRLSARSQDGRRQES